jgi:hypothetical protein
VAKEVTIAGSSPFGLAIEIFLKDNDLAQE